MISEDDSIFDMFESLHDYSLISSFGSGLLTEYMYDVKENHNGSLSDDALKNSTLQYNAEFESHGYKDDSGEGRMIGNILTISIHSIEWWKQNPDATDYSLENGGIMPLSPWAAAGSAKGAISSYVGNGSFNWKSVGSSAL